MYMHYNHCHWAIAQWQLNIYYYYIIIQSRYSDWLRVGRSGDRIPVGGEIFITCPDGAWGPPGLLYIGYRVFPGGKELPGRETDPSPLLEA
jgi:hypothetical protein